MKEDASRVRLREDPVRGGICPGAGALFRFRAGSGGPVLSCGGGISRVTQEGDGEDHILRPGENLVVSRRGMVVVQALEGGRLCINTDQA